MNIIVGISWPFANGDLHLGHCASSLPGDVIARYYRLKGDNVILVSGSDCHGTPIDIKAIKENKTQKELVDICHTKFSKEFNRLGISFDIYNRTDDIYHKEFVKEQFIKYYNNGYLYEKNENQLYCESCKAYLQDRYIIGLCPRCGKEIKGDECEYCNSILNINAVIDPKCAICGCNANIKPNKNLYFKLSSFQDTITDLVNNTSWRDNAISFTKRYLDEKIPDRCASKSLKWGIDIPVKGYEDKKIYGWFENVWGYVSASKKYCEQTNQNYEDYWKKNKDNKIYLVHAKDNIPFHTIIFPALLEATKNNYKLPDKIVSSNYITIEGEKLSKSKGNYIKLGDLLDKYNPDTIRYFFLINEAVNKDFNFTWDNFINTNNSDLVGKWGNFINRNLVFINKSFDGVLSSNKVDVYIENKIKKLYEEVGKDIEKADTKKALNRIIDFINYSNKYFDDNKPWSLYKENISKCEYILYNCLNIIYNINNIIGVYLPFSKDKVNKYLNNSIDNWNYKKLENAKISKDIKPLFERI